MVVYYLQFKGKKRQREKYNFKCDDIQSTSNHSNISNNFDQIDLNVSDANTSTVLSNKNPNENDNTGKYERNKDVEVKLICDLANEEIKKIFSKSVIYKLFLFMF